MTQQATHLAVRKTITVEATPERAFAVWTDGLATWWPLDSHHIGAETPVTAVIEPRAGGRCYERDADGTECDWGVVRTWEPPTRLVVGWHLQPDWSFDPDPARATEYEVRFVDEGGGRTRVEVEHRGFEIYGDRAEEIRDTYLQPNAWGMVLELYAKVMRPKPNPNPRP